MKIAICIPAYGDLISVPTCVGIMDLSKLLAEKGIPHYTLFISNDSLITRARNNLIAKALNDPDTTHIMFIDADIHFKAADVLKLILHDKDLVGGIYPLKTYKWENLSTIPDIMQRHKYEHNKNIPLDRFIKQNLMKYNLNYQSAQFAIQNNLFEVEHLATGFMMIKRSVFETMMEKLPNLKFFDDMGCLSKEEDRFAYTFFDCATVNGHYYSEDWLFCHRWKELGGKVFADVSIDLTHIGAHRFEGRLISSITFQ